MIAMAILGMAGMFLIGIKPVASDFDGFPSPTADKQRRLESIPSNQRQTGATLLKTTASELAYSLRGSLPNIALADTDPQPLAQEKAAHLARLSIWWAHTDLNSYVVRRFPAWILSVRFFGL
jgi:hypothetical protein